MGLVIDSFAGGGGASTGIEMALGRSPDIAINHNAEAIAMHSANHPQTEHYIEDIWQVDPVRACRGREVDLMWLSPDCTHFSKAKGGTPKSNKIRGLAWVAVRWAKAVRPRVIILENVEEFKTWGPLDEGGMPVKHLQGETFGQFVNGLRELGYEVENRELRACDYGAPTIRKRFFLIARCDDQPIVWPERTHGLGTGQPDHTASECIDWSIACPSIFGRKRPLAEATLRRIARGIVKYVLNNPQPYIVPTTPYSVATLVQTGYGERKGQAPRTLDIEKPLGTVVGSQKHALVSAFLTQYHGEQSPREVRGQILDEPIMVVDAANRYGLVACSLMRQFGTSSAAPIDEPMPTVMPGGCGKTGLIAAFLTKYYGNERDGCSLTDPLHTVTSKDRLGLVTVSISGQDYVLTDIGMRMLQPRELFRAQGFPDSYIIDPVFNGKPLSKVAQVRAAGNSVCPPMAAALVRANCSAVLEAVA